MVKKKTDISKQLQIAVTAAKRAGRLLRRNTADIRKVNKSLDHDVKIEADVQSEEIIIDYIKKNSPYTILSEESGLESRTDDELFWIVDPVDGSLNYAQGIPLCCVSIGLWKKEEPVLGVIYDFWHDELYHGIAGGRAYLNGKQIKVSRVNNRKKALLCSGFPNSTDYTSQGIQKLIEYIQTFRKVRFLGSAAVSIAYVACGRAEAYFENDIMLWDIAGGVPLVLAAGGEVKIEKTSRENCFKVFVSNGRLQE